MHSNEHGAQVRNISNVKKNYFSVNWSIIKLPLRRAKSLDHGSMDPLVVYTILAAFLCGFSGYSFIRGVQEINNGNKKFRVNLPCSKGGRGKRKSRRKNRKTTNVRPTSSDSTLTNKSSRKKKKRSKKLRKASGSVAMFTCPCLYYCLLRGSDSESDKSKRKKSSHVMKGVRNCCCCCCCDFTSSDDDTC